MLLILSFDIVCPACFALNETAAPQGVICRSGQWLFAGTGQRWEDDSGQRLHHLRIVLVKAHKPFVPKYGCVTHWN